MSVDPQLLASDPATSAFVTANAGSGKTTTLVNRVARLLLQPEVSPERILCLTYTKAAAAEMQRRLFETLGAWSTLDDDALGGALRRIGDSGAALPRARTLFARALETPGGLKIQTIHAFCEKLLRRFPLEAGVSPGFTVLEGSAAAEVQAFARDGLAELALTSAAVGEAYAHFAVELDPGAFEALFTTFESEREGLRAYARTPGGAVADVWRRCGFPDGAPVDPDALEADAVTACEWERWSAAAKALSATGMKTDVELGRRLAQLAECARTQPGSFADCLAVFSTKEGQPLKKMGTKGVDPAQIDWLLDEQMRLHEACARARSARMAHDTARALLLAEAYLELYEGAKAARGGLDFGDLIRRTRDLLTDTSDADWVLFKLDGGVDHILVDEAQDTAPEQWEIVRALSSEFFAGTGARGRGRTVFAVGDEKQSIYGFQGAQPALLRIETQRYERLARAGEEAFAGPTLAQSWRSTPQVLRFVDLLGEDDGFRQGVQPASSDVIRHELGRKDAHPGQIDLWPPFVDEPRDDPPAWDAPVDTPAVDSANKRLARRIARHIRDMTERREAVWDKGLKAPRPVRPGDVLILVRRRNALFEEIIRALKTAGVPVAGADRLKLSDHIVFDDMVALVRFVLFPWDDLTCAALLRSPFCAVDEEGLFELAHGRERESLYKALGRRAAERPEWAEATRFLQEAREMAVGRSPFDFLGRALSWLDAEGRTLRQRVLTRLGAEAQDALDAMLGEALAAEARGVTDLERFAADLEHGQVEIKRELEAAAEEGEGAVRVMTVHGAKGLEAPVVILPDTTAVPQNRFPALLPVRETRLADGDERTETVAYLFAPRGADDTPVSDTARAALKAEQAAEQMRLLYVALTRARDRVIVCGRLAAPRSAGGESKPATGSWYERVAAAFEGSPDVRTVDEDGMAVRRYGPDPVTAPPLLTLAPDAVAPPAWLRGPAPAEAEASRYASPSTYAEGRRGPAPSPLAAAGGGLGRFRRGDLIHRLLQLLPDLPHAERPAAAERILARERDLSEEQRREMVRAALGVLEDPRFAEVWAPGSKAEMAVAGAAPDLPEGLAVSGRVDRMLVTPDRVLVVDFKTNRPSPDRIEQADAAYLAQMAIYTAVLRAVFPDRQVEAALVWTDGPKLMPVPENVIEATLQRIRLGR